VGALHNYGWPSSYTGDDILKKMDPFLLGEEP
jgi:hypothetical protein